LLETDTRVEAEELKGPSLVTGCLQLALCDTAVDGQAGACLELHHVTLAVLLRIGLLDEQVVIMDVLKPTLETDDFLDEKEPIVQC